MKMTLKTGRLRFYKLETAAILTGMVLMLIGNLLTPSESEPAPSQTEAPAAATPQGSAGRTGYAEYYAAHIEGIGEVTAAVYVKSEGTGILAENSNTDTSVTKEEDSQGGTREETKNVSDNEIVILKDKDGNETVVYVSQNAPEIEGIAVCVKGGASAGIQEKIKTALMALYDIPASKISITG